MTQATTPAAAPADPFYRSSYAIKRELEPGLKEVLNLTQLSLAELLSMLASDPKRAQTTLSEWAKEHRVKKALAPRADTATREAKKALKEHLKNADPEVLAKMLEAAQAAKSEKDAPQS